MERRSRYVCLIRVTGKETQTVVRALTRRVQRLPTGLMATLTWDRGLELAAHRTFSIATGVQVYFCDPRSPWQRGTNEKTNGLLRQYFPKGTDLNRHSASDIAAVAATLNRRPRKTLGWRTPSEASTNCYSPTSEDVLRRPLETGQYLSIRYTDRLADAGIDPSVGSIGDSYDNALAESVIGLYKTEVIRRRGPWRHLEAVEFATLEWVDWFNHRRLLAPLGHVPPAY